MSQRWKVVRCSDEGLCAREARELYARALPERLPNGAVVEELELIDDHLHFKRVSGIGPLSGWVSVRDSSGEHLLVRLDSAKRKAPGPISSARITKAPTSDKSSKGPLVGTGRQWTVVSEDGLEVRKSERPFSMKLPELLPMGSLIEEVECVGKRLHFLNHSGIGPASGWVSIVEKNRELLQRLIEPSDPSTSFESLKRGFLNSGKVELYPEAPHQSEADKPLSGWAELSKLYSGDVHQAVPEPPPGPAAAAETFGRGRRAPREELPPVEELENMDGFSLTEIFGFDEETAKQIVGLSRAEKQNAIASAKALLEMPEDKRQATFESYRKSWPSGPFPDLAPLVEVPTVFPPGSCFPYSRHLRETHDGPVSEWGLEASAGKAVQTFFARKITSSPQAQREFLQSMRCEVACTADPVRADSSVLQLDPCRVGGIVDKDQTSGTIMAKGAVPAENVLRYLNAELQKRVCIMDGGLDARIEQEGLQEADYRGERFKNFKEIDASKKPVVLRGNLELLVLTKGSLIAEIHKEYMLAGADIIRTNTLGCNALAQDKFKMNKLVYEMNKAAAQLAKKATAEVTKQDPAKPRFVAGVLGPTPSMTSAPSSVTWDDLVEAYDDQLKGLIEGGVDMLMLDGVTDSLNAKAAIFAIEEYLQRTTKRQMPLIVNALVKDGIRMPSGQTVEAFCISLKHAKPLALGFGSPQGPGQAKGCYRALADLHPGWGCFCPGASGADAASFAAGVLDCAKEGLLNFVGGDSGVLPAHIAAVAKLVNDGRPRSLPRPPANPHLQLAGLEPCMVKPDEGLHVAGAQCTVMGSAKFKKKISAYKATGKTRYLQEAMEVCLEQREKGAEILDFNLDSDMASGPACPAKGAMTDFMRMASAEPKVARVPFMLCSCEWNTIKEGLKCVQGKCIVNGLTLMVGEEEFLRIAKECQRFGAALVILAINDDGTPADTMEDKVRICQRSYKLLRSKLDFPPEDIIFDCQVLLLGLPEFAASASSFIGAVDELKRTCPCASFVAGVNNLSLPFRGLNMLRDALHSVFLYHAAPKGLNLAIAWPGALPVYSEIDIETRELCEELVLNASRDGTHLERFNAFVSFRTNSLACLPVQHPALAKWTADEGHWWKSSAVQKEAKEAQQEMMARRREVQPEQQKLFLKSIRGTVICNAEPLKPQAGAGLPDLCRADGYVNREQLARTVTAKGGMRMEDLTKYLNAELRRRICIFATPGQDKPLGEADYREYFAAGSDVCGTNTLTGAAYAECKAAAQLAKSAAAEATKKETDRPRFVAGVMGPTSHSLSSSLGTGDPSDRSISWEALVAAYTEQVRGLVDGGVDLLTIEMVFDTLNAKAAIFAVEDYFLQTKKERLPLIISATIDDTGKMPSGQSIEAFVVSIGHAKPLSVGISGNLGRRTMAEVCRALAACSLGWCHASGTEGKPEELASSLGEFASEKLVNFAGICGLPASHLAAVAGKLKPLTPRPLPALPRTPAMQLSGLEAYSVRQDSFQMVGQRCNMGGSAKFKGLIDAYKHTKLGNTWSAVPEVCASQCKAGADLLDFNFDSELIDAKWAMGKFMRLCATDSKVARVPFILSSASWPVIEEGLRSVQGKSIVNAISLVQGEEEFLRLARACQRYGAAVIVMTLDSPDAVPSLDGKVQIGQRAYSLLRTKLDFPAEDIIFDCNVPPLGSQEPARNFLDAVRELKRSCPLVSFIGGVGSLSMAHRSAPPLRKALHSVFLYHAIPMGLNMAFVEPGALPRYGDIEAATLKVCEDAILHDSHGSDQLERLEAYGAILSGGFAEEVPTAMVAQTDLPAAITGPIRMTPSFTQPLHTLVQGAGTINASIFQSFASKSHCALNLHKNLSGLQIKRQVWFSSISVWMGQGGSGPVTGASSMMDGIALYERWQGFQNQGVSVEWGAIGEIGLRRTIYGSRDVFAQFDLGQKLIGPADTQFLMRAVCVLPPDPYEVVGMAYLDQTWQMTLAGIGTGGGLERKTFADM